MLSCVSLDFYFYFIAFYETFKITSRFLFVLFCYFLILFLNRNLPLYTGTFTKQIYSGSTHGSGHHPVHLPRVQCQANTEQDKWLHLLQLLCFTVSAALFLVQVSNTRCILELLQFFELLCAQKYLTLQKKTWYCQFAEILKIK